MVSNCRLLFRDNLFTPLHKLFETSNVIVYPFVDKHKVTLLTETVNICITWTKRWQINPLIFIIENE